MDRDTRNPFLNLVMAKLREERPLFPQTFNTHSRLEYVNGVPLVNLWFRTRGCKHDHQGGCTMCNYGASTPVQADDMIESVRGGLAALDADERMMLVVSPCGSMFDEWEVPARAREGIFQVLREFKCSRIICESRVDTITEQAVKQFASLLSDRAASIEIGLESSSPWILKYCINKSLILDDYKQAMSLLHEYTIESNTNVMLGSPFLSARESIEDAVETIRWALSQGSDWCTLFPIHVKKWTLVEWLWRRGLYSPPSLWSLVEVLERLGPEMTQQVTLSWYKNYYQDSQDILSLMSTECLCSPSTCPECQPRVMKLLHTYRDTRDFNLVHELGKMSCSCKQVWRKYLEKGENTSLPERVARLYEMIGRDMLGAEWWEKNGNIILKDILT